MKAFKDYNLQNYNSYQLVSSCKKAYFPESLNDIQDILKQHNEDELVIIGNGNNILLSKTFYNKSFIIFNGNFNSIESDNEIITVQAGATLEEVSSHAARNSLSGMEVFWDIPSSIGGALVMNAGASGESIADILTRIQYIDTSSNSVFEKSSDELDYSYRNSIFQKNKNLIVTGATFQLIHGKQNAIYKKMTETKHKRHQKQPRDFPNCGSVFKRPEGKFVGPMIDQAGLKGYSIGGAQVSEKHSGFIINRGGATARDILSLIEYIQETIFKLFGVQLEIEQRII